MNLAFSLEKANNLGNCVLQEQIALWAYTGQTSSYAYI